MREIKFRAWAEKKTKEYEWQVTYKGFMTEPFDFQDFDGDYFIPDSIYIEDMKIMQFTGLKDKNGKEIYEGDILYFKHNLYEITQTVRWGSADETEGEDKTCVGFVFPLVDIEKLEVIGNIYENPELGKGNKE